MKRFLLWVLIVGVVVGALVFGKMFPAANSTAVDVDLLWVRVPNVEVWLLLSGSIGFGALLATLVVGFAWLKARLLNRRYRKVIKRLETELHQMRSLPLSPSGASSGAASVAGKKAGKKKGRGILASRASRAPEEKTPREGVAAVAEGRG